MDAFCIGSSVLGTEKNLSVTDEGFSWRDDVPLGHWHLTGNVKPDSDMCLDSAFKLARLDITCQPPAQFVKMMSAFSGSLAPNNVPWAKVMPRSAHKSFAEGLVSSVVGNLERLPLGYLEGPWRSGTAVLGALQRPRVDEAAAQKLLDDEVGNVHVVRTFLPLDDGRAQRVKYNRFGSLTGRLTVESGPGILTLKRSYRNLILPERGHKLVSIDFAALEARIVLYEAGKTCDVRDLYGSIAAEMSLDRNLVKGAIISELYGMGKELLSKKLNIFGDELDSFVKKIKAYFNTAELVSRVKSRFIADGFITNRYGRPVFMDNPLSYVFMNYYAQSTGVDVTMLGFNTLLKQFDDEQLGCVPYYVLHDALIASVPEEHVERVKSIDRVKVPGYVQPFFLKTDVIQ